MTSRFEGFPMVLLEALSSGLPCIAFDCPVGPRALISNQYNGFLINEGRNEDFVNNIFIALRVLVHCFYEYSCIEC